LYELNGGALCLDFANTVDSRPTERRRDLIPGYGDLVRWGLQASVLTASQAEALEAVATSDARLAETVMTRARTLREAIFEIFSATAAAAPPPGTSLEVLNEFVPATFARLRLQPDGSAYRLGWEESETLERALWPVVRSAVDLLVSDLLGRVRICAADSCSWLFLDESRNRSRRWCDMTVCGNRDKARRFRDARRTS
jgi:predicted RNA-binding Zn ribbon-like protein